MMESEERGREIAHEPLDIDPQVLGWSSPTMRRLWLAWFEMEVHGVTWSMGGFREAFPSLVFDLRWSGYAGEVTFAGFDEVGAKVTVANLESFENAGTVHGCGYEEAEQKWHLLVGRTSFIIFGDIAPTLRLWEAPVVELDSV